VRIPLGGPGRRREDNIKLDTLERRGSMGRSPGSESNDMFL
jgi:hypothetical protein